MIGERDVSAVVQRIVALYDPDSIYVFGSHAKGNATDKSDLDLLIVRPSPLPRSLRGRDVAAVLCDVAFGLDLLFYTPVEVREELEHPYSLISTIMPTARVVYSRG